MFDSAMGVKSVVVLSVIVLGLVCGQGFDPNEVNQQMGGNFNPNGGGFGGGWGWNQVTTSDPGNPTYDPNAVNANVKTESAGSPTTAEGGGIGWGVDSQWGFGSTAAPGGSGGFGSGGFGSGSGFTLSQVLSGTVKPLVGKK